MTLGHRVGERFQYLLDEINGLLKIHSKVNERPFNTLSSVLFLLEDEHVVIEELLQLFVGEVDAQLFKAIELLLSSVYVVVVAHSFVWVWDDRQ